MILFNSYKNSPNFFQFKRGLKFVYLFGLARKFVIIELYHVLQIKWRS